MVEYRPSISDLLLLNRRWWKWCCVNCKARLYKAAGLLPGLNLGTRLHVASKPGCKESLGVQGRCFTCLPSPKSSQTQIPTIRHGNEHTFTQFQLPALELPHMKPRGREASRPGHLFLSVDFERNQCCLLNPLNLKLIRKKQKNGFLKKEKIKKHNVNAGRNWSPINWNIINGEIFNDNVDEKKHITRSKT